MNIDLTPIYRTTVGSDSLASMLDNIFSSDATTMGYPPYNIEVIGENQYAITMAVAGFQQEEFDIQVEKGLLTVRGEKVEDKENRQFIYQGITTGSFERKFNLADYVEVTGAVFKNGLLIITLEKQLPEEMRPRRIHINSSESENVLEHQPEQPQAA